MADVRELLGKVSSPILDKIVATQKRLDAAAQAAPARAPDKRTPAAKNKPKPTHASVAETKKGKTAKATRDTRTRAAKNQPKPTYAIADVEQAKKRLAAGMRAQQAAEAGMTLQERDRAQASREAYQSGDYTARGSYKPWRKGD